MFQPDSKLTLPGAETHHNGPTGHIRLLSVVPADLQALLEKLETEAAAEGLAQSENK